MKNRRYIQGIKWFNFLRKKEKKKERSVTVISMIINCAVSILTLK